jgi:hypothetical protein
MAAMRRTGCLAVLYFASFLVPATASAQQVDAIARARAHYNARDFAAAIALADEVRQIPGREDAADLVAARAYLERYRETAAEEDLANARLRLRRIHPQRFDPRDRAEFVVGLGTALYFEDLPGAAAEVFASLLDEPGGVQPASRDRLLDWWASALDRDARPRPEPERKATYDRVRDRMRVELGANPTSSVAAYWLAAAAAGAGDWQAAWDEAQAAWVRAPLTLDHGAVLLADLDRLVQRGIAPERAKALAQSPEQLLQEWASFKERWTR